jgi:hypothetical protein
MGSGDLGPCQHGVEVYGCIIDEGPEVGEEGKESVVTSKA